MKSIKKLVAIALIGTSIFAVGCTSTATNDTSKEGTKQEESVEKITPSETAIELTVNTLKQDELVKDAAITIKDDTINIAIQVNDATNKDKAKDLIDTAIRQLGSHSGGKTPNKEYLGQVWDSWNGFIRVFSGENTVIQDGNIEKGKQKVTY
ncbi:putative lipoprotein [Clostridium argentinense CDC 2741]|uniref:Putative lipoprotein n=1 Tax=Clostridium argentinense CDC 2741 TaxID=1418104 RepID=A0A0C1R1P8_9CLOT|nr:hypothetical protein [Clostridium argentinense]ARC85625.1 hypothetical protein RSJ17_14480 [Clostridium argentinense]KIE47362.1 putative lipoprotein [Clostridium argentinense CDC 2741]NFF40855.1 hypothetical protein [Clostridium argentinense]NFP50787.1 hypothetical protein [Clostridium argentinense]NFP73056.1 hypothetical protein [Clostridium argentinense]